jgi:hypothetical protein
MNYGQQQQQNALLGQMIGNRGGGMSNADIERTYLG